MSIIRRNVKTHAHRDYTGNGSDTVILSRQEIRDIANREHDAMKEGRISRSDMNKVMFDVMNRRVP
jgi:hypothetical protein